MRAVPEPDEVFCEVLFALDTGPSLLGDHRFEALLAQGGHDAERRDVGVAPAPALVLVGCEDRRREAVELVVGERLGAEPLRQRAAEATLDVHVHVGLTCAGWSGGFLRRTPRPTGAGMANPLQL